ncbi:MAG: ThiF family adenylyltransferase [Chloroflexi bacterium]|nr:MAG: ThiF family adenylyltransferase [Chloroflexota bacterium]
MKKYRLKITEQDFTQLRDLVMKDLPLENGAFALAGSASVANGTDILLRRPVEVPKELVLVQEEYHLELSSQAVNGLISLCESNQLGVIFCHSHNFGLQYSPSDDFGEQRLATLFRNFIPANAPIASLLFSPEGVTGRVWLADQPAPTRLTEIVVVGRYTHRINLEKKSTNDLPVDQIYDRQIRAFGIVGQRLIARTKVGIVGLGGTGSPVAEQLARLGVKDFVLVDPDHVVPSNLSRVYGTYAHTIMQNNPKLKSKVNIIRDHIRQINPQANVLYLQKSVVTKEAAEALLDRDTIFLCTDEHWGRSVVTQIAYQYIIPTINIGASITSTDGRISNALGVIDIIRPDLPCLWCKHFLRSERIAAESVPQDYRNAQQQEGYIDVIDTEAPSVVSLTSTIASMAVSLFLQQLTDFMGPKGDISRLNYNLLDNEIWRGRTNINPGCVCRKVKGFGNLKPLPTIE